MEKEKKLKKTRRGRPIKNKLKKFKVWFQNVRGLKSKMESLQDKLDEVCPTLIGITESHLLEEEDVKFDGYAEPFRNDRDNLGGGIVIAVRKEIKDICTVVEKWRDVGESLWIAIDNGKVKIRVGVVYAPQESRTTAESLKTFYEHISEQVQQARERKQRVLIMGDFNGKIGEEVKGNRPEKTKGGRLLLKMAKQEKLIILNTTEICEGLWTRTEGESRSVIDYILTDDESVEGVQSMMVDENKELSPVGYVENKMTYSDHNVLLASMDWIMMEEKQQKDMGREIITSKGMENIRLEMKEKRISDVLQREGNITQIYKGWKEKVSEIWKKNTTRVKKKNPRKNIKRIIQIKKQLKKDSKKVNNSKRRIIVGRIKLLDEQIDKERKQQFQNKIGKVVSKLRTEKGINGPNMWEVVSKLKRRRPSPPTAIKDKKGNILEDPEQIKARYLEHFSELLSPAAATTEQEKQQEDLVNLASQSILDMAKQQPTQLTTIKEVEDAMKKLKRKKAKDSGGWSNEMILDGGEEMTKSVHILLNKIETERMVPDDWKAVLIKTIGKPGSVLEMNNKRGLFLTEVLSKLYEQILKSRNEDQVRDFVSPFQTGGVKERATVDNHIIFSEMIRNNKKLGRKTYVVFGDAVKCFDKLWLKDSLLELYKAGCNLQDIEMIYRLNEDTNIVVETPFGKTDQANDGEVVKQGTVLGPQLCCVETDQINKIGESQDTMLGDQTVAILIFVDDVMKAGTANDVRKAIRNFAEMEKLKKFTYGLKKTNYMILRTGREKDEIVVESVKNGVVQEVSEYKYLGLWVNRDGNLMLHLDKKGGQITGQVSALKSLASYHNVGSEFVKLRLKLYELCLVPSILYNLEGWNKLTKAELKKLESIQHRTLCTLLHLPKSTPYVGLLNELGMWRMEEKLMYRKMMLYHNIIHSSEKRLCRKIIKDQEKNEEEGTFYHETKVYFNKIGIDIKDVDTMLKSQLKKTIKERLSNRMVDVIKKTMHMTKSRFQNVPTKLETKKYINNLSGTESLKTLKTRLNMQPVYGNFKCDITKQRVCQHCNKEDDTTEHLVSCKIFETGLDPEMLKNEDNYELWKQINQLIDFNLNHRLERPM